MILELDPDSTQLYALFGYIWPVIQHPCQKYHKLWNLQMDGQTDGPQSMPMYCLHSQRFDLGQIWRCDCIREKGDKLRLGVYQRCGGTAMDPMSNVAESFQSLLWMQLIFLPSLEHDLLIVSVVPHSWILYPLFCLDTDFAASFFIASTATIEPSRRYRAPELVVKSPSPIVPTQDISQK
jgi:hypothetical protein